MGHVEGMLENDALLGESWTVGGSNLGSSEHLSGFLRDLVKLKVTQRGDIARAKV